MEILMIAGGIILGGVGLIAVLRGVNEILWRRELHNRSNPRR